MESVNNIKKLTRAAMLLAFALVITFIGARFGGAAFNSFVVGPLINAVILTAVLITDLKYGTLVAVSTPLLALLTGQLAMAMAPFAPFIMIGNAILALVFGLMVNYIKGYGVYAGIIIGALLKTLVLVFSVKYLITLFNLNIPKPAIAKLSVMMSYPQLYTAIAGGIIALIFYSIFKRTNGKA